MKPSEADDSRVAHKYDGQVDDHKTTECCYYRQHTHSDQVGGQRARAGAHDEGTTNQAGMKVVGMDKAGIESSEGCSRGSRGQGSQVAAQDDHQQVGE